VNIDIILVLYAKRRVASTARIVKSIARFIRLRRIIIVVNGMEINLADVESLFSNYCESCTAILHDNTGLEFGGYQAGVDFAHYVDDYRPERVILMNDTVGSHQYYSMIQLRHFCRAITFSADRLSNFVTGYVYDHERRITINGMVGTRWVRSNLVGLDKEAITRLGHKIYDPSIDKFITDSADIDTFLGPDLDSSVKLRIADWLFSTAPGKWYNAQPLSSVNSSMMAKKAKSYLQEQWLSMRLETIGAAFYISRLRFVERCMHRGLEIMGI
jgi:hypothetical protein